MAKAQLSEATLQRLEELLRAGVFSDADDAVNTGLDLYSEAMRQEAIARLRAEIDIGLESGPAEPFNVEEFLAEMEQNAPERVKSA